MRWLEEVRSRPKAEKIRLIWKITIITAIILIALWILLGKINGDQKKDFGIFQTIEKGISDYKKNK